MNSRLPFLLLVLVAFMIGGCAQLGVAMYRHDLNDDIVARVLLKQTEQQVVSLLGQPYQRMRFNNLNSTAMDYLYMDTWGYWTELSVMIGDNGRVVDKVLRRIDGRDSD